MKENSLKYTCIFGGGAVRAFSYVGVFRALKELNVDIQRYAGSSAGAVCAALSAVGYDYNEILEILLSVNFELFKDIHFSKFGKDFAFSKGEVFQEWVREHIEKKFYGEKYIKGEMPAVTFKDLDKDLVIITTDLVNFKYKEFSKYETPDYEIASAVRISAAMPGLMKPVSYNNTTLADGDLLKGQPMCALSNNLRPDGTRVLEFRLEGDYGGKSSNAVEFLNTVYSCATSATTEYIVEEHGQNDKFDFIVINTGAVIIIDFNQSEEKRKMLVESGYEQTMDYFENVLTQKKKGLLVDYSKILSHIELIKKYVVFKKIKKAETELGRMYMELADCVKKINPEDYKEINAFRDLFMYNFQESPLFCKGDLKNQILVEKAIKTLYDTISKKVEDLRQYCI